MRMDQRHQARARGACKTADAHADAVKSDIVLNVDDERVTEPHAELGAGKLRRSVSATAGKATAKRLTYDAVDCDVGAFARIARQIVWRAALLAVRDDVGRRAKRQRHAQRRVDGLRIGKACDAERAEQQRQYEHS